MPGLPRILSRRSDGAPPEAPTADAQSADPETTPPAEQPTVVAAAAEEATVVAEAAEQPPGGAEAPADAEQAVPEQPAPADEASAVAAESPAPADEAAAAEAEPPAAAPAAQAPQTKRWGITLRPNKATTPAAPPTEAPPAEPAPAEAAAAAPTTDPAAPTTDAAPAPTTDGPALPAGAEPLPAGKPPFQHRAKLRRRLRYLRRVRELAFRDLGGLVFDLHRFGKDRPDLIEAKLSGLASIDHELRSLEVALDDIHAVEILEEPGIAACAHCGALRSSDARFCSACGRSVKEPRAPPAPPAAETPSAET